ncbi:hypothetical protein MIND_00905600 [Mycena indigotica]|uniref:Transmembrane protein n=1 Tax=Mycena indigotica TaxID=2126181 RepID=A0A8H6SC04_9AGAR|nr:uncharacterized protein MIND_00905600 [Mycena indigotica]KAF7296750.1 hypothetical protein MIND_00905600 [Mycena indigotica]
MQRPCDRAGEAKAKRSWYRDIHLPYYTPAPVARYGYLGFGAFILPMRLATVRFVFGISARSERAFSMGLGGRRQCLRRVLVYLLFCFSPPLLYCRKPLATLDNEFVKSSSYRRLLACRLSDFSILLLLTLTAVTRTPRAMTASPNCNCDTRTLFSIVWGCLSTIFACIWVSVHPNVPPPRPPPPPKDAGFWASLKWRVVDVNVPLRRRFKVMLVALFAPELIFGFALRQFIIARTFTRRTALCFL